MITRENLKFSFSLGKGYLSFGIDLFGECDNFSGDSVIKNVKCAS